MGGRGAVGRRGLMGDYEGRRGWGRTEWKGKEGVGGLRRKE